jgi:hypothetical protein
MSVPSVPRVSSRRLLHISTEGKIAPPWILEGSRKLWNSIVEQTYCSWFNFENVSIGILHKMEPAHSALCTKQNQKKWDFLVCFWSTSVHPEFHIAKRTVYLLYYLIVSINDNIVWRLSTSPLCVNFVRFMQYCENSDDEKIYLKFQQFISHRLSYSMYLIFIYDVYA